MGSSPSSPKPFDQSFETYKKENDDVRKFWKDYSPTSGTLIHRVINWKAQPTSNKQTKDAQEISNNYRSLMSFTAGRRSYIVHVPPKAQMYLRSGNKRDAEDEKEKRLFPLVLCLHGTDETAFDTELFVQEDGSHSWLEQSTKDDLIVVFPQARGQWATEKQKSTSWRDQGDDLRTLWIDRPVDIEFEADLQFLCCVLHDISNHHPQFCTRLCPCRSQETGQELTQQEPIFRSQIIDPEKLYVVGFSNGGFQCCDLLLASRPTVKDFPPISGGCLYMGGMLKQHMLVLGLRDDQLPSPSGCVARCRKLGLSEELYGPPLTKDDEADMQGVMTDEKAPVLSNTRVLVVSSDGDCQMFSSCRAWQCFLALGFKTGFKWIKGVGHEYQSESTAKIWEFFQS